MKFIKDRRFYKFFIPSLIGAILFVIPINQDGNLTIPIAVAANKLLDLMGDHTLTVIWFLVSVSSILTLVHRFFGWSVFGAVAEQIEMQYLGKLAKRVQIRLRASKFPIRDGASLHADVFCNINLPQTKFQSCIFD